MIRLESEHWRLWVEPNRGAQWMAASVRRDRDWCAVVPDCRADAAPAGGGDSLSAANFHMLPYSNRIRDGRFTFDGETVQLAHPEAHAIHGALRQLPWKTVRNSDSALLCRIDSREHSAVNWPWPIVATIAIDLDGRVLSSTITLTNVSDRRMPAGLGWHPYFLREIDGASPELTLPVSGVYPDAAGDGLPDGAPVPLPPELDFTVGRPIDPAMSIDCCLAGFGGEARIAWPKADIALRLRASEVCDHVVLYNPDAPYFAVEPVSNANDAFNLAEAGIAAGRAELAPGESLTAEMRLELA